jgi:hypothetical protein
MFLCLLLPPSFSLVLGRLIFSLLSLSLSLYLSTHYISLSLCFILPIYGSPSPCSFLLPQSSCTIILFLFSLLCTQFNTSFFLLSSSYSLLLYSPFLLLHSPFSIFPPQLSILPFLYNLPFLFILPHPFPPLPFSIIHSPSSVLPLPFSILYLFCFFIPCTLLMSL